MTWPILCSDFGGRFASDGRGSSSGGRFGGSYSDRSNGSGGGRGSSWSDRGERDFSSSSKRDLDNIVLPKEEFEGLIPFEKNFYVEHPEVASLTEDEVAAYRKRRQITVEGRDIPKPVRTFDEASFPGTYSTSF